MDYRRGIAFPSQQPPSAFSATPSNGLVACPGLVPGPARNAWLFAVSCEKNCTASSLRFALGVFVEPSARVRYPTLETKSEATWGMFFYDLLQGVRGMGRLGHFVSLVALRVTAAP